LTHCTILNSFIHSLLLTLPLFQFFIVATGAFVFRLFLDARQTLSSPLLLTLLATGYLAILSHQVLNSKVVSPVHVFNI
jgi:hypothetical protein